MSVTSSSGQADQPRDAADHWIDCRCGHRHWGLSGAAGLLVNRGDEVLLQLRAPRSHHGGTWGLPGGARHRGEPALAAALREAQEETGLDTGQVIPAWWSIADHGDWSYTTFAATAPADLNVGEPNWETSATAWVARSQVPGYDLHPGLAAAWPVLESFTGQRLTLVVDAANVVGSRPDGWWRDRAGAARRLRDRLEPLVHHGLANIWSEVPNGWFPEIVMVVEGQARGIGQGENVRVVDAPGEGDNEIVAVTRQAVEAKRGPVLVVTADKALIGRIRRIGAQPAPVRIGL
jgi:8-oxo-dGTP pyrophosphatase MutT (NUDIX family)